MEPSGSPGTPSSDDPKAVRQVKEFARWCHSSAQARSGIKAYQSPIQVMRFTTQLHFVELDNLPKDFLPRLSESLARLDHSGWGIWSVAPMGRNNSLLLEFLSATLSPDKAQRADNQGEALVGSINPPGTGETHPQAPSTAPATAAGTHATATVAPKPHPSFLDAGFLGLRIESRTPPSPGLVMAMLQESGVVPPVGSQVLLQSGPKVHLLHLTTASTAAAAAAESPQNHASASSPDAWCLRELSSDDPIPGLMNLDTQPHITCVTPRCVASDGRAPVVLRVKGKHLQGGTLLARHGGRYLATRRMAEGRIQPDGESGAGGRPKAGAPSWYAPTSAAAACNGGAEEKKEEEEQMSYLEVLIEDPPLCGLVCVECKQGLLLSNPLHVAVVPAGSAIARELAPMTAHLNQPLPTPQQACRTNPQLQMSDAVHTTMACALKSEGEPKMSVKLSKQQWAMQSVPLSKVCDLPDTSPKDGAGPSDSGMYDRGSRTHPDGGAAVDVSRVAEAYEEVVRDLGAWIQFWQLTRAGRRGSTEGSGSEGSRGAPIFSSDGAMLGFSCTQRPTAQGDLTEQLHDVIAASPAHAVLMGEVGMQLLALCCDLGWASMARWVLQGLLEHRQGSGQPGSPRTSLADGFRHICARVASTGLGILHRAVLSRSAAMVAEVVAWYTAAGVTVDWGEKGMSGLTPLHLAACAKDGGLLAIHILRRWAAGVGCVWDTVQAGPDGLTPADCARGLGLDFLNRMVSLGPEAQQARACGDLGCAPVQLGAVHSNVQVGGLWPPPHTFALVRRTVSVGVANAQGLGSGEGMLQSTHQAAHNSRTANLTSAPSSRERSPGPSEATATGCIRLLGFGFRGRH